MKEDELKKILESDAPNEPEALPMVGTSGAHSRITPIESRQRREMLSYLLASGKSNNVIFQTMYQQFGMKEGAVQQLKRQVYAEWAEEDAERKPYMKKAARERLYRHIEKASKAESWTAIANLEKVLASIEGTAEPIEVNTTHTTTRVTEALLVVLNESDPRKIRELIESERALIDHGETVVKALPAKTE